MSNYYMQMRFKNSYEIHLLKAVYIVILECIFWIVTLL